jgi:hypothetical protein
MYKDAATAKTQFGTKMKSTKVMNYLFLSLNMMWNAMDHFDFTGEPMSVHESTHAGSI